MVQQDNLIKIFLEEASEYISLLDEKIVQLEQEPENQDLLDEIFRAFHTLKGNAGLVGFKRFEKIAHLTEEVLSEIRDGKRQADSEVISFVLEALDRLKVLFQAIEATGKDETATLKSKDKRLAFEDEEERSPAEAPPASSRSRKSPKAAKSGRRSKKKKAAAGKQTGAPENGDPSAAESETGAPTGNAVDEPHGASTSESPLEHLPPPTTLSHWHPTDTALRVDVDLLDQLMNMVGELVLARNHILRIAERNEDLELQAATQRLNQVTTELQEGVMKTRMQPVGYIFSRFHRVVRDLTQSLNKEVVLRLEGEDTELDKTLLEAMRDPLLHLVRNAIDHGIEEKEERERCGKPKAGTLILRAYHESGQVILEVVDDGKGIDPERLRQKAVEKGIVNPTEARAMSDREALNLIFRAGFSTAERVTNISGRGVGMDVVKYHIEKIGGSVELHSELGKGTTVRIKIPLTLAIIPALMARSGGQRFAIPQVNLLELIRLEGDAQGAIERLGDAEVFRLRGQLIPILRLDRVLGLTTSSACNRQSAETQLIVLTADGAPFGLVVDEIDDTEEIVVKSLNRHLKDIDCFAGATVMGDGKVALILDVAGLAHRARIQIENAKNDIHHEPAGDREADEQSLLLFTPDGHEMLAVSAPVVARLEVIQPKDILIAGGQEMIRYGKSLLPVLRPERFLPVSAVAMADEWSVIVIEIDQRQVGLLTQEIQDIIEMDDEIDTRTLPGQGFLGSFFWQDQPVLVLDVYGLVARAFPEWFPNRSGSVSESGHRPHRILLVEDSSFYRSIEKSYLEVEGFTVVEADNGKEALALLRQQAFDLIITDIEMPEMDGLALCRAIREVPDWRSLPVIIVSSRNGAEDIAAGKQAGADAYLIKLDQNELIRTVQRLLNASSVCESIEEQLG